VFKDVKIPKKIDSPIKEAVFEVRYEGEVPGEALYGILFDIFKDFPNQAQSLPILQIPPQMREADVNLRYQPFYRAITTDKKFVFSVGPRSILFSALEPYDGWTAWTNFIYPKIETIRSKGIIKKVERIGLRTLDLFDANIFGSINAELLLNGQKINTSPSSFFTEFAQNGVTVRLNVGNAANVNGEPTKKSLIDIDCIYQIDSDAVSFFKSYREKLNKMHEANKAVFFGLIKETLLKDLNPEF